MKDKVLREKFSLKSYLERNEVNQISFGHIMVRMKDYRKRQYLENNSWNSEIRKQLIKKYINWKQAESLAGDFW